MSNEMIDSDAVVRGTLLETSNDADEECLLCLTNFQPEDVVFRPCKCTFKICRFCWYRLITTDCPRCPMCRSAYSKERSMGQLKGSIIPRLESIRQVSQIGEKAFDLINLLSYFHPNLHIPTDVFNEDLTQLGTLADADLINVSPAKSKMMLASSVPRSDLRRCTERGKTLRIGMEYLQCVLNPMAENVRWRNMKRSERFQLLRACMPHALALWSHILKFDETELLPGSTSFFACLCDRLDQVGLYEQLQRVTSKTMDRFTATFGPCHLNTLRVQADLATSEWRLGHLNNALDILTEILPMAEMTLGREHWLTMSINNELAFILNGKGLLAEALEVSNEVCRISRALYGERHPDTLTVTRNKGILLLKIGDYADALKLFYDTYKIQKRVLGGLNLATINTQFWIGQALLKQGYLKEALRVQTDVYEKQKNQIEQDDNALIRGVSLLAFVLNELEDFEKVVTLCEDESKRLGTSQSLSDSGQTVSRLLELVKMETELAKAYLGLGKGTVAKVILTAVHEIQTTFQGPKNLDTRDTEILLQLCEVQISQGVAGKIWEMAK